MAGGDIPLEEVDALAESIARKLKLGLIDSASAELTVFLNQLIAPRTGKETGAGAGIDPAVVKTLMERITMEEEAAKRALDLAATATSPLAKMILKQMAVDSMRHADILTALVHVFSL